MSKLKIALIFLFFSIISQAGYGEIYNGEPATIAHVFLDLEKPLGANAAHYKSIDSLINKAKTEIKTKENYTTEEAVIILSSIHNLLKEAGFVYKPNFLMSRGIETKQIDCDTYSALYISIAEILRIPLIPVSAPNHSFIRFCFTDATYLNWEPTEGKYLPDAFYIKQLNIASTSIDQGVFLNNLSRKEFTAIEYNNIGAYYISLKKFHEAIPYFDMAIALYPKYSSALHNRGVTYYAVKQSEKAFADLNRSLSLNPVQADTLNTLGDIYFDNKEYGKALEHYRESIKYDPDNYVPYYSIGLLMKIAGKDAEEWFNKSRELKKKYSH